MLPLSPPAEDWRRTFVLCSHLAEIEDPDEAQQRCSGSRGTRACCAECDLDGFLRASPLRIQARADCRGAFVGEIPERRPSALAERIRRRAARVLAELVLERTPAPRRARNAAMLVLASDARLERLARQLAWTRDRGSSS